MVVSLQSDHLGFVIFHLCLLVLNESELILQQLLLFPPAEQVQLFNFVLVLLP